MKALEENDIIVDGSLFIDEPNAAFLGYINSGETAPIEMRSEYNPKVLVFDFGAGTCDISLLEITADHHGMHSNNLSISQFAELGGNDIDRYIANNFLLPQLLKANNLDGDNDLLTSKQKDAVANQLLGIAENMKKRLCETDFNYLLSDPDVMDEVVASGNGITIDTPELAIHTNSGTLTIGKLWLTANRAANCDNANIDKVVGAAESQIRDIRALMGKQGLTALPEELRELAALRLENPEASLHR